MLEIHKPVFVQLRRPPVHALVGKEKGLCQLNMSVSYFPAAVPRTVCNCLPIVTLTCVRCREGTAGTCDDERMVFLSARSISHPLPKNGQHLREYSILPT